VLRISNEGDSIRINILFTPDMSGPGAYHIVGMSRNVVCYGANIRLNKDHVNGVISKNAFPSGIAHFTVFDDELHPVNERMIYVDRADNLNIDITSDKEAYATRDSVALRLRVTDKQHQPVIASFSLAVTDDAQVLTEGPAADNIITRLLLSSELKGTVEDPAWYFTNSGDSSAAAALDALMLTQGWMGYDWTAMLKKMPPAPFIPQTGFAVTGRVTNLFNKPMSKAQVLLISTGRNGVFLDTITNNEGRFVFSNFPVADSPVYVVQARNSKGKNFGVGLEVDEFKPAEIHTEGMGQLMPWYVNGDTALLSYVKSDYQRQQDIVTGGGRYKVLKNVVVKGRKGIRGSHNLNEPGEADQVLDEKAMIKAAKLNLKQILEQNVKGFRTIYGPNMTETYRIFTAEVHVVIDGVPISRFGSQKETLEYIEGSDIKGIEVMTSMRTSSAYRSAFLNTRQMMAMNREFAFIEVTTYSGNGAFLKHTPGVMLYRPLPVTWPVTFYSPRYRVKDGPRTFPDRRSTVFWEPNLVTSKEGNGQTSFYTADKPSTYTVILQGSDMNGSLGYRMKKIVVH
ncbi:MAG: carboxypeptidase regulatory-like domain-containing protein, partial [Bacteroidetes bacterium]|nr:carboxypeptidase regulatory-like domain-containing protein [Bacteroidota bacterium]